MATEITKRLTMEERQEPRFVKFATGVIVEGILTTIERVSIQNKAAVRYTVEEMSGEFVQFLGTHQINTKLRQGDIGHGVHIRCKGEDTMVKRGENCMKVFEVFVSKELARNAEDALLITDADIGF